MNTICKKSLFVSSLTLLSLCAILQVPTYGMEKDEKEANRGSSLIAKQGTGNPIDKGIDPILTSLGYGTAFELYDFYEVFETLEDTAAKAHLQGKYDDEGDLWAAMAFYACAIEDPSSKYGSPSGISGMILDVGIFNDALGNKQKEIKDRKLMGFKAAGKSYFQAKHYSKSGAMWDWLNNEDLTIEEIKMAAKAHQLAKNFKKAVVYRRMVVDSKSRTDTDVLDFAEVLWEAKNYDAGPESMCWNMMKKTKDSNPAIYNRALTLFQTHNPLSLKSLMNPDAVKKKKK